MNILKYITIFLAIPLITGCSQPDKPDVSFSLALKNRNINQIERHIYWGTDLTQTIKDDLTALHIAAQKGQIIIVKLLLKQGLDINIKNARDETPLLLAILEGRTQIADILIAYGAKLNASEFLLKAVQHNVTDRDIISYLIERDADIETTDTLGNTPLLIAIKNNNHRLSRHLIKAGAQVNQQNNNNESPLEIAIKLNNSEIQQLLIKNGAN